MTRWTATTGSKEWVAATRGMTVRGYVPEGLRAFHGIDDSVTRATDRDQSLEATKGAIRKRSRKTESR